VFTEVAGTESVAVSKAGVLRQTKIRKTQGGGEHFELVNHQRRYIPMLDDTVIGVVVEKHGESFNVDIGAAHYAVLSGAPPLVP
jgi:exosome complex RNA-binding protein Rrp4